VIRILLLEDDDQLRNALAEVLEVSGYQVVAARDGSEAVERSLDFQFELFIFDVKLPGPDGLEVLARFKQANPDLPSIVITGYASEADTLRALRLGVGEYLKKPFNSSTLLEAVKRLERVVIQQRTAVEQGEIILALVKWSLEFLNTYARFSERPALVSPREAGVLAYRVALARGYGTEAAAELQAAVLLKVAREESGVPEELDDLTLRIPERILHLSDSLADDSAEGIRQIGAICARLPKDPKLLGRIERMAEAESNTAAAQYIERQRKHLLSLGRSLAATQDLVGAEAAFQAVLKIAPPKERGSALIELSRLAWRKGDKKSAVTKLKELLNEFPGLGPQTVAELELEAAQISLTMGLDQGLILLKRAQQRLQRLQLQGPLAQVEVGLALLEERELKEWEPAVRICLTLPQLDFLVSGAEWLLPLLVDRIQIPEGSPLQALACRVAAAAPVEVTRLLTRTNEESKLVKTLTLLKDGGLRFQEEILQNIVRKRRDAASRLASELLVEKTHTKQELRIFTLGKVEIWVGDAPIPLESWRTSRSLHMLPRIALGSRRSVLQERVAEDFWPGTTPDRSRRNLSQTLTDLRKALKGKGYEQADTLIERKHDQILLNPKLAVWVDLESFKEAAAKGDQCVKNGEVREAVTHFREAVNLVRDEFMVDCNLAWCEPVRRDLERQLLTVLESLAECCASAELYPEVEEIASRILAGDPCHQVAHRLLMETYVAQGKPEQAIRQFEKARVTLLNEMGIEPQTDLLRVHQIAKLAL